MRAMWMGFAVAIAIAVIAGFGMNHYGQSTAERFSGENTRIQ